MRKILLTAFFALLTLPAYAIKHTAGPQTFSAAGAGTVLADTGNLTEGGINLYAYCSCSSTAAASAACAAILQHRNVADGADIWSQLIYMVPINTIGTGNIQFVPLTLTMDAEQDESYRIILASNITGTVQCTIIR